MASLRRLGAALAGIGVAFVFVMVVQALTPDAGLHEGAGEVRFERFAFATETASFTVGSVATLVNGGAVPTTFVVTDPGGANTSIVLLAGGAANVTLDTEGRYKVTTQEWPWAAQTWQVRTANPFERFFEDLF